MGPDKIIALVTGVISILGTVVAVSIYITKLQSKIEIERLKDTIKSQAQKSKELEEKYVTALRAGSAVTERKRDIDNELMTVTDAVEAEASSILVAQPTLKGGSTNELVFLSLLGPGSENLKRVRVPMNSIAGEVFRSHSARITHSPQKDTAFSSKTDEVSKSTTKEMLAIPLTCDGVCVGVAEFLNKKNSGRFSNEDQVLTERLSGRLARRVGEFIGDPNNFVQLGITPERVGEYATILFSYISNSSELSLRMNEATVIDVVNEYFETLCDAALSTGGTIDKFMGDGFMLTFNVGKAIPDHELIAIETALQMQIAFDKLKKKWQIYEVPPLFNRIGIESGRVLPAMMGHWQLKQATIMGEAVNAASALCETAPRGRNAIVIGSGLWSRVSSRVKAREVAAIGHKEVRAAGLRGWEVSGISTEPRGESG